MKKLRKQLLLLAALLVLTLTGCEAQDLLSTERADSGSEVTAAYTMTESQITDQAPTAVSVLDVPEFSGEPYVVLNGNEPDFTDEEKTTESYEHYSDPDSLGRCGVAEANIGQDLMPTEKRGAIGQVKPTGWHTVKYDQVENTGLQAVEAKIEKIIVFWWNRHYPSDRKFDLDLSKWNKVSEEEFAGYSHEKITKEVYEK